MYEKYNWMIYCTFYRPSGYFEGTFNSFAAWWTSGEYCHCELVLKISSSKLMSCVKEVYDDIPNLEEKDQKRLIPSIENFFFLPTTLRRVQQNDEVMLSFSLLWGETMCVRFLDEDATDYWYRLPSEKQKDADVLEVLDVDDEQTLSVLRYGIGEMGKQYDTSGALFSWLPLSSEKKSKYETYFCSEFCVMALQNINLLSDLSAPHTTPNALYKSLKSAMNSSI